MAITYTDNLTLPIVPADNQDWADDYNTMIEKLDRNPGIRIVADEAAMVALNVWEGRECFRQDLKQKWRYLNEAWDVYEIPEPASSGGLGAVQDTTQETTSLVAPEASVNGDIEFESFPGQYETMLLMVNVQPDADDVSVTDEAVTLTGTTAMRLTYKPATSVDETGTQVSSLVVEADDAVPEIQTIFLGGATGGTFDVGLVGDMTTLNYNDSAATIQTALEAIFGAGMVTVVDDTDFTVTFDESVGLSALQADFASLTGATDPDLTETQAYVARTVYTVDTDYTVTIDSLGYTNIARVELGSITDAETILVSYDYQPGVTGFKFQVYSEATRTNLLYELDTSQDPDWLEGFGVRDPTFGMLPVAYYVDEDEEGKFWYKVTNLDEALSSRFVIDMKYKSMA